MSIPSQISNTLTSDEQILYHFEKPFSLKAPGLIFTNKRLICYKPKHFGLEFKEYGWQDVHNISMKEGLVNGEIEFELSGGNEIEFKDIPKSKLQEMYTMARELKEKSAVSSKPVVTPMEQSTSVPAQEDPMAKLKQLKDMLDAGLITQDEYDKTKTAILSRM